MPPPTSISSIYNASKSNAISFSTSNLTISGTLMSGSNPIVVNSFVPLSALSSNVNLGTIPGQLPSSAFSNSSIPQSAIIGGGGGSVNYSSYTTFNASAFQQETVNGWTIAGNANTNVPYPVKGGTVWFVRGYNGSLGATIGILHNDPYGSWQYNALSTTSGDPYAISMSSSGSSMVMTQNGFGSTQNTSWNYSVTYMPIF